jgi:hypothetical protein
VRHRLLRQARLDRAQSADSRSGGSTVRLDPDGPAPGTDGSYAAALVEGMCAVVDRQDVQDNALATLTGIIDESADEVRADAATLVIGMQLNTGHVDLGRGGTRRSGGRPPDRRQ